MAVELIRTKIPYRLPICTVRYDRMVPGYRSDRDPTKPGPPLSGFENGQKAHDQLWVGNVLTFPHVYTVTTSFFRGVCEKELASCQNAKEFRSKFVVQTANAPSLESLINTYIDTHFIINRK